MFSTLRTLAIAACVAGMGGGTTARADIYDPQSTDSGYLPRSETVWSDPAIRTGIGVGIQVGGGVTGFVAERLRNTTGTVGGEWSFRAAFGTHTPLALELGYIGSETAIEGQLGRAQANLVGTTLEAVARLNLAPQAAVTPYLLGGVGWQRYTIDDQTFELNDTGIATRDDLMVLPIGAGIAYRHAGFVTDVRGTIRAARGANLVLNDPEAALQTGSGTFAPMHSWDASLNVGYEF